MLTPNPPQPDPHPTSIPALVPHSFYPHPPSECQWWDHLLFQKPRRCSRLLSGLHLPDQPRLIYGLRCLSPHLCPQHRLAGPHPFSPGLLQSLCTELTCMSLPSRHLCPLLIQLLKCLGAQGLPLPQGTQRKSDSGLDPSSLSGHILPIKAALGPCPDPIHICTCTHTDTFQQFQTLSVTVRHVRLWMSLCSCDCS